MENVLLINMQPLGCDCPICGRYYSRQEERNAVPYANGDPCLSTEPCDGYRCVCDDCYVKWDQQDDDSAAATSKHRERTT